MIEKTARLVNEKKIAGISDIRDESDKDGLRVVYELKKEAVAHVVLNNLYKHTALQTSFGVNNVALVEGRPQILNLKEIIHHFVEHRHEIVTRKTKYELSQAAKKLHLLEGYLVALDHLDGVIALIRAAEDPEVAKQGLIEQYTFSEEQAKAILDMRLQRLTGLEREKITQEYKVVKELSKRLKEILDKKELRMRLIKEELLTMKEQYGDVRKTQIEYNVDEFTVEDMIPDEEMVITISHQGYIKRTPLAAYKTQGRGGVGVRGAITKEDDFTEHLFVASTHSYLLIFTEFGQLYWKKVYAIPEGSRAARGRAIQNLIQIEQGDKVRSVIKVKSLHDEAYVNSRYVVMCTEKGIIKKTLLKAYAKPRHMGIHAIKINERDRLLEVKLTKGDNHIVLALQSGRAIHFHECQVRSMGRITTGVKGIKLVGNDCVIGMVGVYKANTDLLVVSEKGYGKRSPINAYRITRRGGKGILTMRITEKTGALVAIKEVVDRDELMIINKSGVTIRIPVADLRVMGRATQGVRLIRLNGNDEISAVEKIERIEE